MNCNIGELTVSYRGAFEVKINKSIALAIEEFGYEIESADYDEETHICYLLFKKECG